MKLVIFFVILGIVSMLNGCATVPPVELRPIQHDGINLAGMVSVKTVGIAGPDDMVTEAIATINTHKEKAVKAVKIELLPTPNMQSVQESSGLDGILVLSKESKTAMIIGWKRTDTADYTNLGVIALQTGITLTGALLGGGNSTGRITGTGGNSIVNSKTEKVTCNGSGIEAVLYKAGQVTTVVTYRACDGKPQPTVADVINVLLTGILPKDEVTILEAS